MNQKSFPSISYTGMLLSIISVLLASISTKNNNKEVNNGNLHLTSNGGEFTCVPGSFDVCTVTIPLAGGCIHSNIGIGSRTTTSPLNTSSITINAECDKVTSLTEGVGLHTSLGPM